MNDSPMPATLNDAILTEPMWLQGWVGLLVIANLLAFAFVATKQSGKWAIRTEAVAILVSFFAAAALMTWMYGRFGYVRLLGVAHLIFWGPVFVWLIIRYRKAEFASPFSVYLAFYLLIAGISLVVDSIDVLRYLFGDTSPLHV
jgi:hypothetical protein